LASVRTKCPAVALTFDDGPDPHWTPRLLELLAAHDARATFFMVGRSAERWPELVEAVVSQGHMLANHGWSHRSLPQLGFSDQVDDIRRGAAALGAHGSAWFRPPYGHQTVRSRWAARLAGQRVAGWSAHIGDWRAREMADLADDLRSVLAPGAVVLLHEAILVSEGVRTSRGLETDRSATFAALDMVLDESAGIWRFITLSELLSMGRARWAHWIRYSADVS